MTKSKLQLLIIFLLIFNLTVFSQTANWKKYSSSLAGFSIKYPSDWTVDKEEASGRIWQVKFGSPRVRDRDIRQASLVFICSKPKGALFNDWGQCRQKDDHLSASNKDTILSDKTFKIAELKIRRLETEDKYKPSHSYIYAFFSTKDRDFLIRGWFPRGFGLAKYIPVFDKILKSFKSLSEREVTIYKNDKYDFAITYPSSWKSCSIDEINYNPNKESLLKLVPSDKLCQGNEFILVSRMTKLSNEKNNLQLMGFLNPKNFTKITPHFRFGNIKAALGEKINKRYIYRERYFYTNYPQTYELLKLSEMFEASNNLYRNEREEILKTARRFLKNQWYDNKN